MKCKNCSSSLEQNAIFCPSCGWQTEFIRENLSAKLVLKGAWQDYKGVRGKNYPFAIFFVLLIMVPVGLAAFFTRDNYWINNLAMLLLAPLAMVPLTFEGSQYSVKQYFTQLKNYPKLLGISFFTVLFFFVINVICTGNPLFYYATDPILHPVRFVLVLYWLAIIVPSFYILTELKLPPCKSIYWAYKWGRETRWQQFFLIVVLAFLNVIAVIPVGLGLLVSVPFTAFAVRRFSRQLHQHGIFERKG